MNPEWRVTQAERSGLPKARLAFFVATLGSLGLLAYAVLYDGVPPLLTVIWLGGYVALSTLGVLVPQLEMYGDVVSSFAPGRKCVALTFDDGPHPVTTTAVLDLLESRGQRATFFVIGEKAEQYPDIVRRIHGGGHTLGLHGFTHARLYSFKAPRAVRDDIVRTQDAVERICGVRPTLFRPPVGYVSHRTAAGARAAGVKIVIWSVRGLDGLGSTSHARVVRRIARKLEDGAIVMLHDAAEREHFEPAGVGALPEILDLLERAGLQSRGLGELLEVDENTARRVEKALGPA